MPIASFLNQRGQRVDAYIVIPRIYGDGIVVSAGDFINPVYLSLQVGSCGIRTGSIPQMLCRKSTIASAAKNVAAYFIRFFIL